MIVRKGNRWLAVVVALIMAAPALAPANLTLAQGNSRTFPETGKTVQGTFLNYWNTHGGLAQQGFPITEERQEVSDTDGKTYTMQYFERAVFELHPENQPPNDVLLSLLGVFLYKQKYPTGAPGQTPNEEANARLFPETGKKVGGIFLDYWNNNGGLAQQGFPISDEFLEKSDLNGKIYKVQYFERAVFEQHPENAPPYNVLLSQLGKFRLDQISGPTPTPTATATPIAPVVTPTNTNTPAPPNPCADIPASVNQTVTPSCGAPGTVFSFVGWGFEPGERVGVYATMPDQSVFGAPFQVEADSQGRVGGITLTTPRNAQQGIWASTMEGTRSHAKSIGYFKVVSNTPPPPPPPGGETCDTSGTHDGSATPTSGRVGTTIIFRATGFTRGESVSFWFTLPNGDVYGTPAPIPGGVNSDGSIGPLPFTIEPGDVAAGTGRWALTFEGATSHHQAIIYFCILP